MRFVKNEWIKLWCQRSTWVMFILTLVGLVAILGLNRYFTDAGGTAEERLAANNEDIAFYEKLISNDPNSEYVVGYKEEIELIQYRIENDLPSSDMITVVDGIDLGLTFIIVFVGISTMVVAAYIVSNEFGTGTIKRLLTRPAVRWKMLLSKLVTTIIFGIVLMVAGIAVASLTSYILYDSSTPFTLGMVNGEVVQTVVEYNFIDTIAYSAASTLMTIFFAFMLSTLFGSSTLAVSLALGILFMGSTLSMFLAQYDFAQYILFVNNLGQFAEGSMPIIPDLTFGFALTVNIVYAVIFLGVSFIYFTRRDVTA